MTECNRARAMTLVKRQHTTQDRFSACASRCPSKDCKPCDDFIAREYREYWATQPTGEAGVKAVWLLAEESLSLPHAGA